MATGQVSLGRRSSCVSTRLIEDNEDSRNEAYTAFVTCLKYNHNYAPAYTSLGIFYADMVNDLDRAYRCFQKAFELDAGEVEAAERLARNFADSRQWDLVEVVARRLLQASRKRVSTKRELSWPHRALGVAELVYPRQCTVFDDRTSGIIREPSNLSKLLCEILPKISTPGLASERPMPIRDAIPRLKSLLLERKIWIETTGLLSIS